MPSPLPGHAHPHAGSQLPSWAARRRPRGRARPRTTAQPPTGHAAPAHNSDCDANSTMHNKLLSDREDAPSDPSAPSARRNKRCGLHADHKLRHPSADKRTGRRRPCGHRNLTATGGGGAQQRQRCTGSLGSGSLCLTQTPESPLPFRAWPWELLSPLALSSRGCCSRFAAKLYSMRL